MQLVEKVKELKELLFNIKQENKSIGFVPTMGALHQGHLSLLERARKENDIVVCSIFVNPVQFNNLSDLEKYPRTLEQDLNAVRVLADVVFVPAVEEVYPLPPEEKYNFGNLERVMEGSFRPGHFNGVAIIVKKLLDWVNPDKAYFGEKDFQQLAIVKKLVKDFDLPVEIVGCPIIREKNGLAMSSRNKRLSEEEFALAGKIYEVLSESKTMLNTTVAGVRKAVLEALNRIPEFKMDYFEIVDGETLQPLNGFNDADTAVGCVALYIGDVRLIDNIRYK